VANKARLCLSVAKDVRALAPPLGRPLELSSQKQAESYKNRGEVPRDTAHHTELRDSIQLIKTSAWLGL